MTVKWTVSSDKDNIKGQIAWLGKTMKQVTERLHFTVCSCLLHAVEHGNSTPLNDLFTEISKGKGAVMRVNTLKQFVSERAEVDYDDEQDKFVINKDGAKAERAKFKAAPDEYVRALSATPWNEAKPEPKFKPLNLPAEIAKLVKKAEGQMKNHANDEGVVIPVEMLNTLRRLKAA